ncbi:MAG TPA: CPBP family intramembrane glutamic endopeptidase [Vulgatibacter sp.]|nr:CPBP family intramembrane glutamic endopeptidase [Vulgatibacter sp.]
MHPSSLDLPPSASPAWIRALLLRQAVVLPIFAALVILAGDASDALWRSFGEELEALQAGSLPFYALWLVPLSVGAVLAPRNFRAPFGLSDRSSGWASVAAWVVAVGGTAWLYWNSIEAVAQGGPRFERPATIFVAGAVVAPFAEEWIFRGVLWKALGGEGFGRSGELVALAMTSIAFGMWHLPFSPTPVWIHGLFGLLMGLLRWRTGSLLPCTLLHGLGNAISLVAR